jgi:ABC-2 type transport system ATP-binding protein
MTFTPATAPAVETRALRKLFGQGLKRVEAVRGIDLSVGRGEIFGFLGPNGAGKTTTLRMLTTLIPIESGQAIVSGLDVALRPREVRRRIGYVGQLGGADLAVTGRENLVLQGELYGASARQARDRAAELIAQLELSEFADRIARTYSGGQRRRLEVALGIMHRPDVLFLDEPSLGLDPQNRANLWDQVRALRDTGTTIFLTTHYLEEADALADHLAIIDHGRIVAEGSPGELKQRLAVASIVIEADLTSEGREALRAELAALPMVVGASVDGHTLRAEAANGADALLPIATLLQSRGVPLQSIALAQPSLDAVFLHETGRSLRDAGPLSGERAR